MKISCLNFSATTISQRYNFSHLILVLCRVKSQILKPQNVFYFYKYIRNSKLWNNESTRCLSISISKPETWNNIGITQGRMLIQGGIWHGSGEWVMALTFGLLSTVPLQQPWATVCSLTCSKIVDFHDSYLNKGTFKDLGGFLSFLNRDAEGMCKLRETLVCCFFFYHEMKMGEMLAKNCN